MGTIITFYSYKGGVGRTMALTNVAVLLAQWKKKVLVVDWDLEAPGVEHFFFEGRELGAIQSQPGLIDLLTEAAEQPTRQVEDSCRKLFTTVRKDKAVFQLLTAGARSTGYFKHVRELDVKSFYEDKDGGHIIENLRNSWKDQFDFVLIDSRTGITDIGGICTIQLPDILALVFTATEQSLTGAVDVAAKASVERQKLPFDRAQVTVLPLPSRFDTQTEHEIAKQWLGRFETALEPLYKPWVPKDVNRRRFLEVTKIPYTPYFSFGEKLPVIEQGTTDPTGLGFAYETIAALLANNLQRPDLLLENRDEFIRIARLPAPTELHPAPGESLLHVQSQWMNPTVLSKGSHTTSPGELILKAASEHGGAVSSIDMEGMTGSMVLVFAQPRDALSCALAIQERLAISTPILTPAGPVRVRMGLHMVDKDLPQDIRSLSVILAAIANKAREGQIVATEQIRDALTPIENLRFDLNEEQMEFISDDAIFEEQIFNVVALMTIELTKEERAALFDQPPETKHRGGFQAFLVGLQKRVDPKASKLELTVTDRERIARYAHDYKGGGWQARLRKIFGRTLGPSLGRLQARSSQ